MNKIEALEKTIHNLKNNFVNYSWYNNKTCNCGVLTATLLNTQDFDIWENSPTWDPELIGGFSMMAYCLTTGEKLNTVFQALKDAGFTFQELQQLEFLSNPVIIKKGKIFGEELNVSIFNKKEYLINYLENWVELLKEEEIRQKIEEYLSNIPTGEIEELTVIEDYID